MSGRTCSVCGAIDNSHPCQTPSGKHWYELAATGEEPMPAVLAAALTDPALRTPEQHDLLRASSNG
jgi:hypothetical protein